MSQVIIYENPMESNDKETTTGVRDVFAFLQQRYPEWPKAARIYHNNISLDNDVTPHDEASTNDFKRLRGIFHVVVYPEIPIAILIAIIIGVVAIGLAFLLRPKSSANLKNNQQTSPNNSLSNRQNQQRPGERIPDIGGQVISVPDLIQVPYRVFINSQEVEIAYLCIGVGKYTVYNSKDDTTPLSEIAGASCAVYDPFTSPNSGDAPSYTVGSAINRKIVSVQQSTAVNGQTLLAPNQRSIQCSSGNQFFGPDYIRTVATDGDFTAYFEANDVVAMSSAAVDGYDFSGTYTVLSVTKSEMVFANPGAVNPAWNTIAAGAETDAVAPFIAATGDNWIGPFIISDNNCSSLICNFVADNGLYEDDGTNQYSFDVEVEIEVTAVDNTNAVIGAAYTYNTTVSGSATVRTTRASTLEADLPLPGPCSVRSRRITPKDTGFKGTIVDTVQWRDCYSVSPVSQNNFGNITTVQTQTYATQGALSVKQRKLNFLVTRWVQQRKLVGNAYTYVPGTDNMGPSTNAADIMMHFALDSFNGNRDISEVDAAGIYALLGNEISHLNAGVKVIDSPEGIVGTYFGTNLATQFGYTFDDSNVSFEELFTDICNAVFCFPYRRGGNLLGITFEKRTQDSTILFNHRNKVPGSETRTFSFGMADSSDGIELTYINPNAANYPGVDTSETLYFPADRSAINPKKITALGVRNNVQATFLGWRYYQKLRYQRIATSFEGLEEAELVLPQARMLVADNTRDDSIDGDVLDINGLTLTLSQPTTAMIAGRNYFIYLQHVDGSVESISCSVVAGQPKQVLLTQVPALPLVTDPSAANRLTGFIIAVFENFSIVGESNIIFTSSDTLVFTGQNLTNKIAVGDQVIIDGGLAMNAADGTTLELSATTTITAIISADEVQLAVDWSALASWTGSQSEPASPLVTFIRKSVPRSAAFLMSEKTPANKQTWNVKGFNYDERYYQHDNDFTIGVLASDAITHAGTGYPNPNAVSGAGGTGAVFNVDANYVDDGMGNFYYQVSDVQILNGGTGYDASFTGQLNAGNNGGDVGITGTSTGGVIDSISVNDTTVQYQNVPVVSLN
jgi:hypothetical protein